MLPVACAPELKRLRSRLARRTVAGAARFVWCSRTTFRFPFNRVGMNAFTSTNDSILSSVFGAEADPTIRHLSCRRSLMATIEELADRVERLLLRHEELQRTNALLTTQLGAVTSERDNLRSRLNAARSRIDVLLQRLPREAEAPAADSGASEPLRSVG